MKKSIRRIFVNWFLIPLIFIAITVIIVSLLKKDSNENQKVSIYKNTISVVPKVNWLVDWTDQPVKRNFIKELSSEYSFNHQDVKLNVVFSDFSVKTRQAMQIVNMIKSNIYNWDIVWIDESVYLVVAQELNNANWGKDYLVDFQKIEGYMVTHLPEIIKNTSYRKKTGNIMIGPYLDGFYGVLWYNKKVADLLGIDVKNKDMNFDDIIAYAEKIYKYNINRENKTALFSESTDFNFSYLFQNLLWSEIDRMGFNTTPPIESAKNILLNVFTLLEKLGNYNPLIESHMINLWYDAKEAFINDKALFLVGKTSLYNELQLMDSTNYLHILPAELPSYEHSKAYYGSFQPTFAVMKYSPNSEAAVKLIKNISNEKYAEEWIKMTKNPTGLSCDVKENFLDNDPINNFLVYIAQKYDFNVRYSIDAGYILGKPNAGLFYLIDENVKLILTGEITAEKALENIINNLSE